MKHPKGFIPGSETEWEVSNPPSLELCPCTSEAYTMGVLSHLPNQAQLTGLSPSSLNLNGTQAKTAANIGTFLNGVQTKGIEPLLYTTGGHRCKATHA